MKRVSIYFTTQRERRYKIVKFLIKVLALLGVVLLGVSSVQAASPKRGGTLILALSGEPDTMTAHLATDTSAMMAANNIFSAFIGLDMDFMPIPDLAESLNISDDVLTYTFNMVKNAKWHDGLDLLSYGCGSAGSVLCASDLDYFPFSSPFFTRPGGKYGLERSDSEGIFWKKFPGKNARDHHGIGINRGNYRSHLSRLVI